jgi:hypothetical protein
MKLTKRHDGDLMKTPGGWKKHGIYCTGNFWRFRGFFSSDLFYPIFIFLLGYSFGTRGEGDSIFSGRLVGLGLVGFFGCFLLCFFAFFIALYHTIRPCLSQSAKNSFHFRLHLSRPDILPHFK